MSFLASKHETSDNPSQSAMTSKMKIGYSPHSIVVGGTKEPIIAFATPQQPQGVASSSRTSDDVSVCPTLF